MAVQLVSSPLRIRVVKTNTALETEISPHNQRRLWSPVALATPRYHCKVRRSAPRKQIQNQSLTRTALKTRSAEVWRLMGREREFQISAGVSQCGGLYAKPVVIRLLCALEAGRECWSQKDWRRGWDS